MKYTIEGFSQQKLIELKLNNTDALILRWFIDFQPRMKKLIDENGEQYNVVKYQAIINDLPSLEITSKDRVSRLFAKLVNAGVLARYVDKDLGNVVSFKTGPNYMSLVCSTPSVQETDLPVKTPGPSGENAGTLPVKTPCHINKDSSINNSSINSINPPIPLGGKNETAVHPANLITNGRTKMCDEMRDMAYQQWLDIIEDNELEFTEMELDAIEAYAKSKPSMPVHIIKSNLSLLIKWAQEGKDIEDSLRQSHSTKSLIKPGMRMEVDARKNRIYDVAQLVHIRDRQIKSEKGGAA